MAGFMGLCGIPWPRVALIRHAGRHSMGTRGADGGLWKLRVIYGGRGAAALTKLPKDYTMIRCNSFSLLTLNFVSECLRCMCGH